MHLRSFFFFFLYVCSSFSCRCASPSSLPSLPPPTSLLPFHFCVCLASVTALDQRPPFIYTMRRCVRGGGNKSTTSSFLLFFFFLRTAPVNFDVSQPKEQSSPPPLQKKKKEEKHSSECGEITSEHFFFFFLLLSPPPLFLLMLKLCRLPLFFF